MTGLMRQWIVGITCAAMIAALADCIMPEGGTKKVGRLTAGLLLILSVVQPLVEIDYDALSSAMSRYRLQIEGYTEILELEDQNLIKAIIEQQTDAYISDKAEELGMEGCTVEVSYHYGGDGEIWPESVIVRGSFTESQQESLSRVLEAELAIPKENQTFERMTDQ